MLKSITTVTRALLLLVIANLAAPAFGDIAFFTDRLGYTGTVSVYDTLADAQNQVNARAGSPHAAPQRDLAIFFNNNTHFSDQDYSIFLTAWYYTTNGGTAPYSGSGNPSNTNEGFIQMYDIGAVTPQSVAGEFSTLNVGVAGASEFTLNASGTGASAAQFARFWHAPNTGGAAALTAGTFHEWALDVTVGGLTVNEIGTWYIAENHPTSVSGSMTGIFENTNTSDLSLNGFYRYDYNLNLTNWAWDNQGSLNGAFSDSFFAAAVPEPSTGLATLAVFGIALIRRKRS